MDWKQILSMVVSLFVLPLIAYLGKRFGAWLKVQTERLIEKNQSDLGDKYIAMLSDTIQACVLATSQTYVDALKQKDAFDKDAQLAALNMTKDAVLKILTADAKDYLSNAYGDLQELITQKIESEVKKSK